MREILNILPPKIHCANSHCSSYLLKDHATTEHCKSKVNMRKLKNYSNDCLQFYFVNNLLKTARYWPTLNIFTLHFLLTRELDYEG